VFESVADLYERVRPAYPVEAIDWLARKLGVGSGSTVLDLGAGTGKLTRAFVPCAGRVIAVEPGPNMLAELRRAVPRAEAHLGAAEAIPLPDASVDAVVCGQSFHWFRADEALAEIGRVLRPQGGLGLVWNVRDRDDPVQEEVTALLHPFMPPGRPPLPTSVVGLVDEVFGSLQQASFPFEQQLDAEGVVGRILSISFVAAAPAERREELADALREVVARRGGRVAFRYVSEAYVSFWE
jgi:ubiquinone/menaquinone biosynthesis C-methylase UbiE